MTLHRTFISVELSDEIRRRAAALQDDLRAAGVRLRWVKPHHLHFTLRFLGELSTAQVALAVVATREAAAEIAPFAVTLAGLGAFPTLERPQVIWIGTSAGAESLETLAARVSEALAREHFGPDRRPFRAHLTLGRVRDERHWGELVRALRRFQDREIGEMPVESVTVMESRLTPEGPIYAPREQVRLGHALNSPSV
ncbi:MAG: RNA 2',3'-cyclic phosphodiesterase [Armatimonadota bacterium]|nr:RNA 2',3'-cyclic phosphodiesterase [Armatimonadota bacterium]